MSRRSFRIAMHDKKSVLRAFAEEKRLGVGVAGFNFRVFARRYIGI